MVVDGLWKFILTYILIICYIKYPIIVNCEVWKRFTLEAKQRAGFNSLWEYFKNWHSERQSRIALPQLKECVLEYEKEVAGSGIEIAVLYRIADIFV